MIYKDKRDTNSNRANWNHLNIIQKIREQHTGRVRNLGSTGDSHIGRGTHSSESTDVQNIRNWK